MVTGQEHWTTKQTADGDVRLFLWEKFVGSPDGKPALLFVHGSSMASQPTFDLTVPGRPDSSVMDWFAERGFVCWCVDMEGYGRSSKHRDIYCDIANGADDLEAATDRPAGVWGIGDAIGLGKGPALAKHIVVVFAVDRPLFIVTVARAGDDAAEVGAAQVIGPAAGGGAFDIKPVANIVAVVRRRAISKCGSGINTERAVGGFSRCIDLFGQHALAAHAGPMI